MQSVHVSEKQESPPAGNRKRRTASSITCPNISYPGGYLPWLGEVPTLARGYLPWLGEAPTLAGGTNLGWGVPTSAGGLPTLAWGYLT